MASLGIAKLSLHILLCLSVLNSAQGKEEYKGHSYPFIKPASSFSSSSTESNGRIMAYYNYIIVGGVTVGCPLAVTLSRNFRVLLLERGGVPYSNPNVSYLENFHIFQQFQNFIPFTSSSRQRLAAIVVFPDPPGAHNPRTLTSFSNNNCCFNFSRGESSPKVRSGTGATHANPDPKHSLSLFTQDH
ncbi:(R)-mandelonitrile lyase 3-like [Macadamia integrifolia]|uniref:(R)-mandelonitrile lyase 3-like n=1 Tax=Macadamia integrifolia TaxID=60698 RepID=UPI001C4FED4C|nr:(R)-mandelonitrile lyase 3-like [Macadamia integrifolia]